MAHLIDFSTGRAGMAYVGQTPWHGLGEQLQRGAPLEQWQVAAGMDWHACETTLHGSAGAACVNVAFPDSKGLFRSDNNAPLAIVGENYKVVQPREALEFFRDLAGGFELETAGCLDEGRKFWALARTGQQGRIGADDLINGYLLLASSLDGSMATTAQFTSVRVVCNNTLRVAVQDTSKGAVKVRHRSVFDANAVKSQLGLLPASWDQFMDDAQRMAETPILLHDKKEQTRRITAFLCETFGGDPSKELEEQPNKRAMIRTFELLLDPSQNPGADKQSAKGTVWGLVNAVTRFVDFERRAQSQSNRLEAAWFGLGADTKARAWDAGLKLAA